MKPHLRRVVLHADRGALAGLGPLWLETRAGQSCQFGAVVWCVHVAFCVHSLKCYFGFEAAPSVFVCSRTTGQHLYQPPRKGTCTSWRSCCGAGPTWSTETWYVGLGGVRRAGWRSAAAADEWKLSCCPGCGDVAVLLGGGGGRGSDPREGFKTQMV